VNSQSFLEQVREHGLLSEERLAALSQRFAAEAPLHELTEALVEQGWLTRYQIERIWAGKAKGLMLGQYRILAELGQGGFGCVYKAEHLLMNRVVALKVIAPEMVDDSRARAWFRREVLTSTRLEHPNIVMAYDANEFEDVLFLVMEYVDGPNLAEAVKTQGPLPIGLACALLLQSARALQYANDKGVVHRDIKPANLLLPRMADGTTPAGPRRGSRPNLVLLDADQVLIKIVDFGLARLQCQGSPNTLMGLKERSFVGTPDYISPEQARNVHEVDIRADLYSLGCTFFFALTGRPPFKGKAPLDIVLQHLDQEPPGLDTLRPEVPPALVAIIRRLMAKKPEQRFQSPGELVAELGFFFGSGALLAAAASLPPAPPLPASPPAPGPAPAGPAPAPVRFAPRPIVERPVCDDAEQSMPRTVVVSAESAPAMSAPAASSRGAGGLQTAGTDQTEEHASGARLTDEEVPETGRFPELWRQWLAVIQEVIQRQQPTMSEAAYAGLYGALVRAAQIQPKKADDSAVFGLVETAVAPWLSLSTLQQTDPQTLASLWSTCRQLEQRLGLGPPARRVGPWAMVAVLALLVLGAGVFWFATGGSLPRHGPTLSSLGHLVATHRLLAVALAVPPLVLGSFFFLTRMSRRT
jgi:serine/threonine protein kinase